MSQTDLPLPDVYSARDIARALNTPVERVRALFASGRVRLLDDPIDGRYVTFDEALRVMQALETGATLDAPGVRAAVVMPHFALPGHARREPLLPLAISSSVHIAIIGLLVAIALISTRQTRAAVPAFENLPARLVFLATPGPGGGGGGGGLRQPKPATRAQRKGDQSLSSPIPDPPPAPKPKPPTPEPEPPPDPTPPVVAPVATVKNDPQDQRGVIEAAPPPPATPPSQGPGTGNGAGTGQGTGMGEGNGSGVGDGSIAGTGGGPYRPGSGVAPPTLLREVKPDYTEEARRKGVEGEVVMEIVVRRDGGVGDVRVTRGLGYGLDQRAIEAVRQWRFNPATLKGQPVDVQVEVSMEFKLR